MNDIKPPSARQQLAQRFADFILTNNLANPFGGDVSQSGDRRYYGVDFSVPRLLDGEVRVYSERFVLVKMRGPMARLGEDRVFKVQDALKFLDLLLVKHDLDGAAAVPMRQYDR